MLILLFAALAVAFAAAWQRQGELRRQRDVVQERVEMATHAAGATPLQVPVIDLQKCLGCGTCVRECPEEGVLALVHGQAAVVNPAGCVGHARCVTECPAAAVTLSTGDLSSRSDVPVLDDELQAVGNDGVYLVGEITARSLIRTAATQGAQVGERIAQRITQRSESSGAFDEEVLDVVIVGAGPGGLACALACRGNELNFLLVDQEATVGGTVAKYPRRKLVLTDDIYLPLHGRLPRREYQKEELVELWQGLARKHDLPFRGDVTFDRIERHDDGTLTVHTDGASVRARHVVLAVGRRGSPRRLGVVGEDLPHVAYGLEDAAAYSGRHCVVVGGGDSAVETALALAEQPGNQVTIVYRQDGFFRLRSKNKQRLEQKLVEGALTAMLSSEVQSIACDHVAVAQSGGDDDGVDGGGGVAVQLRCDDVFVLAGGVPPFAQLQASGVSFDASLHPIDEQPASDAPRTSLLWALGAGLLLATLTIAFVLWHADYYFQSSALRAADPLHATLRPDRSLGLWFGLLASGAILVNLTYLLRRQQLWGVRFGKLATWMNVHVASGVLAVLLVMLHAALSPRGTPGGYAFWGLIALLMTGVIGRWFYAWLPRAANGRERKLDELRQELAQMRRQRAQGEFAMAARSESMALIERRQWHSTWSGRALALCGLQWDLWRTRKRIRALAVHHGADVAELARELHAVRMAHGTAIAVAHLEDLRALLGTWRWLHRWLALLMVMLVVVHVVVAALHGAFADGGGL
ncbi:MAG: thioredoxin reductase/Pyruvate/2-oxoacid:ferredoxin oxidoreductase delta subunit [Neolewinella sp.]|jgi:thioredoxin reductase/Pyruvate/2-oxoacid:ferredoxin oxidoreductase delta subunit